MIERIGVGRWTMQSHLDNGEWTKNGHGQKTDGVNGRSVEGERLAIAYIGLYNVEKRGLM